jgi:hypothetical protein
LGNLSTPKTVQKLQKALHAKAKAEAGYRFYALYDKINREDILAHAFAQCRSNQGAPGADGQNFADIEAYGVERWLGELALALREESYQPDPRQPLRNPAAGAVPRPFHNGIHRTPYRGWREGPADEGKRRLRVSRRARMYRASGSAPGLPDLSFGAMGLARRRGIVWAFDATSQDRRRLRQIQNYLDQQQLAPFFEMSERYSLLYQRMVDMLEKLDPDELDRRSERRAAIDELPPGTLTSLWVDIDATVGGVSSTGTGIEDAVDFHIGAIDAWLDSLEARLTAA